MHKRFLTQFIMEILKKKLLKYLPVDRNLKVQKLKGNWRAPLFRLLDLFIF